MANLPESASFDAGIYQIETDDRVLGGASGTANTQAKQLANRTKYLKERVDTDLPGTGSGKGAEMVGFLQSGVGAVAATVQSKLREFVSVKDFGAVGDGVTDDTAAIQAAADYCKANGFQLWGNTGTYLISSTIKLDCSADLSEMTIKANATLMSPAILVGPNTAGQYLFNADIKLPKITNTAKAGAGWSGFDTAIGVEVANVYQSRITVPYVYNFGVGLTCGGYSTGCVHNVITLGVIYGNKVQVELKAKDAVGFINENLFIGGRIEYSSSEGTAVPGTAYIKLRPYPGASNDPNNNVFLKPCVEGVEGEYKLSIAGSFNKFINPRLETAANIRIQFYAEAGQTTQGNVIDGGYKVSATTVTNTGAGTITGNFWVNNQKGGEVRHYSGNGMNLCNQTGGSNPHMQGFPSSVNPFGKTESATDWQYRISADNFSLKLTGDNSARTVIDSSGYIWLGRGGVSPTNYIRAGAPAGFGLTFGGTLYPDTDNMVSLGLSSNRMSVIYAGTGTINTSDEREKQQIRALSEAEKAVAVRLKALIKTFKFNDAVQAKGDAARIHVGVIAQEVMAAFQAEGLDPMRYAIVCYDEWEAEAEELDADGSVVSPAREAGNRYGVRYEELLAFIISAL